MLTAIQTKSIFTSLLEQGKISPTQVVFIIDTNQIYTHGMYINSAVFGTASNGYIPITINGTTVDIATSSHTHSAYYDRNSNIDITTNSIVSGNKDLLKYSNSKVVIGNSSSTVDIVTSGLQVTKNGTSYTVLDTDNFKIQSKTSTGVSLSNVALFTYGSNTFQLDYVKKIVMSTDPSSISYTSAGINMDTNVIYGLITLHDDKNYVNSGAWAQLRLNTSTHVLQFRDYSNTTWKSVSVDGHTHSYLPLSGGDMTGSIKFNAGSSANTSEGIRFKTGDNELSHIGANTNGGLGFYTTNSIYLRPNISDFSSPGTNGLVIGSNAFTYNTYTVYHSGNLGTKQMSVNGSKYNIYTSSNSLPTIYAPTSVGTQGQVLCAGASNTFAWKNISALDITSTNITTSTISSIALSDAWTDVDKLTDKLTDGSYMIQLVYGSRMYTGVFSLASGDVDEEIVLHCAGTIDSLGGVERGRLYASIGVGTSDKIYLKLAATQAESNATVTIKYKKLI